MKVRNISRRRPGEMLTRSVSSYIRKYMQYRYVMFHGHFRKVKWTVPPLKHNARLLRWDARRK